MNSTISKSKLNWLKEGDPDQLQWAIGYFGPRRADMPKTRTPPSDLYRELVYWLTSLPNDPTSRELLDLARAAWRQKVCRQRSFGKKAYNFLLPTSAQANLKRIARLRGKGTTMTAALELLITEALETEKHHKKELKALQEKQKGQLEEMKARLDEAKKKAEHTIQGLTEKISDFDLAAKELGAEASRLLRTNCEAELRATDKPPTEEDQAVLDERHLEELSKIKERLARATLLGAFSSRPYVYSPSRAGTGVQDQ